MNAPSNDPRPDSNAARPEAGADFAREHLRAVAAQVDRLSIHNGEALGFYHALADEDLTASELAEQTGTHEGYTRYWLQQQAMTGFVLCVSDDEPSRFRLLPSLKKGMFDAPRPLASHRCLW